jgi:hypothetical protein
MLVMENFRKFSQMETFRKVSGNFPYNVRASIFTCQFCYRNIYVSGNFDRIIYVFIVLSMFLETPEIFITIVNVVPPT